MSNTLNIKDLKAGGKAYLIDYEVPVEVEIEKIGKKYVYIKTQPNKLSIDQLRRIHSIMYEND